ncbi:MAG: hypothetical protein P9M13_09620 [Candidatus Ancaeobacter aquaticus]|nr:hypothetical protein [Candidatus Ancaeobacter aquaticus]
MIKKIAILFLLCAVVLFPILLSGCETVKGTGRDISNFGSMISGD